LELNGLSIGRKNCAIALEQSIERCEMKVFWSWQSDTPGKIGRHFVRDALTAAIEQLKQAPDVEEPTERETRSAMHLDQDRKGISGSPDLARVILEKIEQSTVFVADVTPVGIVTTHGEQEPQKKVINPNVAIELGYALHALSDRSLLMVMNEHYGSRADLPFDLQSKAGPIMFTLSPDADRQSITAGSRQLTARLVEAFEPFIVQQVKNIRQQKPFPEAEAKDGSARFRAPGEPIGSRWDFGPFGSNLGNSISLASGAATWLRLMPAFDPSRTWTAEELRNASRAGNMVLQPFIWSSLCTLRAVDGIGCCNLLTAEDRETNSVAFAFETGEVWAIDTWLLGRHPSELIVGEVERTWAERLRDYATFLRRLGLQAPYRWIAGVTGVNRRRLQFPAAPGKRRLPSWQGPECLLEQITALLPFFEEIYNKCGIRRPEYLSR
jgi:hypothetical protein